MKNIYTILNEIGITVPDEKKAELDSAVAANYKTIAEHEKTVAARDNYKSQLETAQTALKEFDGVDVKELQGKITELGGALAAKEKEYAEKINDAVPFVVP